MIFSCMHQGAMTPTDPVGGCVYLGICNTLVFPHIEAPSCRVRDGHFLLVYNSVFFFIISNFFIMSKLFIMSKVSIMPVFFHYVKILFIVSFSHNFKFPKFSLFAKMCLCKLVANIFMFFGLC